VAETVADMRHQVVDELVKRRIPENAYPEQWDTATLHDEVFELLGLDLPVVDWAKEEGIADEEMRERIRRAADESYAARAARIGPQIMRQIEKAVVLQTLDHLWREHLVTLDHLRQVIGFRGYAQRDPLNEYKTEAFQLFEHMLQRLREGVTGQLMRVELMEQPPAFDELPWMEAHHVDPVTGEDEFAFAAESGPANAGYGDVAVATAPRPSRAAAAEIDPRDPRTWGKVSRNAPCPCGSGKKYKHCHGQLA
jgi:preprotein translocase subunit SecA